MLALSIGVLTVFCLSALGNWRRGVFLATAMAFLQDPLRKLTTDRSPIFILFSGVVFGAALLGAILAGVRLRPGSVSGWKRYLAVPSGLLVVVVLAQAAHSFARYKSLRLTGLGIVSYLVPFLAQLLAYFFAVRGGILGMRTFLKFYLACATIGILTIYPQILGLKSPILGEVGIGVFIQNQGVAITGYSGMFRASEIAAWHAATAVCVTILIFSIRRISAERMLFLAALITPLLSLGIMTGRRKMLVMVVVFVLSYWALIATYLKRARGAAITVALFGGLGYLAVTVGFQAEPTELADRTTEYSLHLAHSVGVFSLIPQRVTELGIAPITWAYGRFGIWGAGLGLGTQGVQYAFADVDIDDNGVAEGGLGKLAMELGFPGLLVASWLGIALVRHLAWVLGRLSAGSPHLLRFACGLAALLIANLASFSIATQTYGDIFVLLFIGLLVGALLATPVMAAKTKAVERKKPVRGVRARFVTSATEV